LLWIEAVMINRSNGLGSLYHWRLIIIFPPRRKYRYCIAAITNTVFAGWAGLRLIAVPIQSVPARCALVRMNFTHGESHPEPQSAHWQSLVRIYIQQPAKSF